ncbi:hypothetical protein [Polyangium sorediatum]|uniref:Uncharacterized protein n=1 Tax=Polyangium sorediatum TaxID=889274 RepID=A0ABT6NPP8_9BACT|nr:hypothetical protein [Polyangium sorediatum]MDI1430160.1 hypothetical protein [Polyangium sorediatum]
MMWSKLSALAIVPAAVALVLHSIGCDGYYTCEDDGTCPGGPNIEIPEGFVGYGWMRVQEDIGPALDPCADGTMPARYVMDPPSDRRACQACSCLLSDEKTSCQLPELECWTEPTCESLELPVNVVSGECRPLKRYGKRQYCRTRGEPTPPSYEVVTGTPTPPWTQVLDVCQVPAAAGAFRATNEQLCIRAEGHDIECPPGWQVSRKAYENGSDGRQCTACACEVRCDWDGYLIFEDESCGNPHRTVRTDCREITKHRADYIFSVTTDAPVLFQRSTGGMSVGGEVTVEGPVTFCCKPTE